MGKRDHREDDHPEDKPHNMAFILLGTAILRFGCFGFNGGRALLANGTAWAASPELSIGGWLCPVLLGHHRLAPKRVALLGGRLRRSHCWPGGHHPPKLAGYTGYCQPWAAVLSGLFVSLACQFVVEIRKRFLRRWHLGRVEHARHWRPAVTVGVLSDSPDCSLVGGSTDANGKPLVPPSRWSQHAQEPSSASRPPPFSLVDAPSSLGAS